MLKHTVRVYGTWDLVLWQCGSKMYDTQNAWGRAKSQLINHQSEQFQIVFMITTGRSIKTTLGPQAPVKDKLLVRGNRNIFQQNHKI